MDTEALDEQSAEEAGEIMRTEGAIEIINKEIETVYT